MKPIIKKQSPNFYAGRKTAAGVQYRPEAIVIHIMAGTLAGTDDWFNNPKSMVSAHYGIGKTGEVHRYVNEEDTAWHAGRVDRPGWTKIKTVNGKPGNYINPNYYTIGIEHEGQESDDWTDEMYAASSELIRDIASRWNIPLDRDHVIGHHEIYSVKTCPGNKVNLLKLVQMAAGQSPDTTPVAPALTKIPLKGTVTTTTDLFIRQQPDRNLAPKARISPGVQLAFDGYTENGEEISGNKKWFYTNEGNWFWSGGVKI